MAKFAYNYSKNTGTNYILFKFNYEYYPRTLFEDETNFYLKFYSTNKLAK